LVYLPVAGLVPLVTVTSVSRPIGVVVEGATEVEAHRGDTGVAVVVVGVDTAADVVEVCVSLSRLIKTGGGVTETAHQTGG